VASPVAKPGLKNTEKKFYGCLYCNDYRKRHPGRFLRISHRINSNPACLESALNCNTWNTYMYVQIFVAITLFWTPLLRDAYLIFNLGRGCRPRGHNSAPGWAGSIFFVRSPLHYTIAVSDVGQVAWSLARSTLNEVFCVSLSLAQWGRRLAAQTNSQTTANKVTIPENKDRVTALRWQ